MSGRFLSLSLVMLVSLALLLPGAVRAAGEIDPALLAGLEARAVGPATMSGRIAAIEVAPSDERVVYVGAATGGLWKSVDAGLTWDPVFEDQPVAAIGAVAVSPRSADVIWVGTGEGNPRNSISVGNGVYRSLDGGETWEHLGLEETERIHRIVLHPDDPDTVWVAALGKTWGENPERGVFKTTDGGESWEKVLYVDERTGAADLVMDPDNPRKLFAAMWDHRRWPWFFRSGGPGSGLYVTRDGGRSWQRLSAEEGLPGGDLGRIGLAVAPSDPDRVYALVESEDEHGLYRSDDGGRSWARTAAERLIGNRPFYYADLRVDPADPNRLYSLWSMVSVSEDGGGSFDLLVPFRAVHPDHHAMWIDPDDPRHIFEGNDGGVYESRDRGKTWRFVSNLPLGQYYHIRVDDEVPYNIYGGMQDNGSWKGPSAVWENGEIRNYHWQEVGFGDGFDTVPLPGDPMRGFAMSQQGYLSRWDLRTGERKDVRPAPPLGEDGLPTEKLRFNWNAAIALDPFDPNTVYYGSQFVHRSRDLGDSWETISPDLTTDNPEWQRQDRSGGLTLDVTGAENFTTIVSIAPSPLERGVIWVGTDDGRLHVTRDGGESWESLEENVSGVPESTWIPHIAPSPHDAGTAFVVFDDHRRSNWTPYVYETTDYGKTWRSLAGDELWGYCLVVEQDPVNPDLLFLGTEFGLWISLDRGEHWMAWQHGVPTVGVRDLAVQPTEHDLVVGTHGRSAFVLDDIRPLRELSAELLTRPIHLFDIPDARQYRVAQTGSSRFPGHGEFRGENEPYGALITFSLGDPDLPHPDDVGGGRRSDGATAEEPEAEAGPAEEGGDRSAAKTPPKVTVEIRGADGEVVRTLEESVHRGVNRVVWDLRHDSFKEPPREDRPRWFEPRGPQVLPGTYEVVLTYGEVEARGEVTVVADPRVDVAAEARRAKLDALLEAGHLQEAVASAIERLHEVRSDVETILAKASKERAAAEEAARPATASEGEVGASPHDELLEDGEALLDGLDELERTLWTPPGTVGIPPSEHAWEAVTYIQRSMGSSWDAPTPSQQDYLRLAASKTGQGIAAVNAFLAERVAPFRQKVREAGLELLVEQEPLRLE